LDLNQWCDQFAAMLAPPPASPMGDKLGTDVPKPNGAPAVTRSKWMDF
jgi:hypothetical protein